MAACLEDTPLPPAFDAPPATAAVVTALREDDGDGCSEVPEKSG